MKTAIYIGILFGLLLALILSNPTEQAHKDAVISKAKTAFSKETISSIKNTEGNFEKIGEGIGLLVGEAMIEKIIDHIITRDNYFLFSITKVNLDSISKPIGFGILSNVILFPQVDEVLNRKIETGTENTLNVASNENEKEDKSLPFYGTKYFNFYEGSGTECSLTITENGEALIIMYPSLASGNEPDTLYTGPYSEMMPFGQTESIKVQGNTITLLNSSEFPKSGCIGDGPCVVEFY